VEAGVHDLEPGIAKGAGDHFCAAIVTVEARLGDEDTNLAAIGALR
jgi:hypothetical protein